MTCLSPAAPPDRSGGPSRLRAWLRLWARQRRSSRAADHLARLDDRALRDLGLPRDMVEPPAPRDPALLWLVRAPG
ncbi:DUF1127 domain-containing protein [Bosea minatitlanensis]|uniref:DUF1127 domain-containing protein n=1 Tax=Bosea minatitlanensis TaxID=128782 RepID=A0ABW0F4L9_9HYPH|nr:DUF1127 domain-containing protein [Bosea minatitlanensis]MCT4493731.1 DUF1127 domain-containing protein [Bosea minatitlanensis]